MSATTPADAIARARAYLVRQQGHDGLWSETSSLDGEGCDWLTGLVGRAAWALLADHPVQDGLEAALDAAALALTRRQRRNGGWAYNASVPTDAESTAWALVCLLSQSQRRAYSTTRAYRYLYSHWDPGSGGFVPRAPVDDGSGPLARAARRQPDGAPELSAPQPCVTAAAIRSLLISGKPGPTIPSACDYLKSTLGEDDLWRSALWTGAGSPTVLALTALGMADALDAGTRAAVAGGVERLLEDPDDLEASSGILAAAHVGLAGRAAPVLDRVLSHQGDDGAWSPSRLVRPGAPTATDLVSDASADAWAPGTRPDGRPREGGRLITTAVAVVALHFARD